LKSSSTSASTPSGQPLGVEFVVAEEFYPFLERHAGALDVPGDLAELAASRRG
jgi:hypothetical protein